MAQPSLHTVHGGNGAGVVEPLDAASSALPRPTFSTKEIILNTHTPHPAPNVVAGVSCDASVEPTHPALEPHFSIGDLSKLWRVGRETVRKLVMFEPGVLKIRLGRKASHTTYSVPLSAALRIHTRLLNPV